MMFQKHIAWIIVLLLLWAKKSNVLFFIRRAGRKLLEDVYRNNKSMKYEWNMININNVLYVTFTERIVIIFILHFYMILA